MVLALGVITIEGLDAALIHGYFKEDYSICGEQYIKQQQYNKASVKHDCAKLKEAYLWYFTLVFITDIVLVLCSFVLLLLFADWILFVAPVRITLVL
jgi:hypothetical protein